MEVDLWGTANGDGADVKGAQDADGELMDLSNAAGTGEQGRAAVAILRDVAGASKD